ncbi:MAG: hypothetical protein JWM64_238 [Frankiales bacterium]|nr:hypothetical protein [Frankiales bacterium]
MNYLIESARQYLIASDPKWSCRHALKAPPVLLCADHPAAGLLCPQCLLVHQGRATHQAGCRSCGAVDRPLWAQELVERVGSMRVRFTSGRVAPYSGDVVLWGAATWCYSCRTPPGTDGAWLSAWHAEMAAAADVGTVADLGLAWNRKLDEEGFPVEVQEAGLAALYLAAQRLGIDPTA